MSTESPNKDFNKSHQVDQCGVCKMKVGETDAIFKSLLLNCLHNICSSCYVHDIASPSGTATCTICSIPTILSKTSFIALADHINVVPPIERCTMHGKCAKLSRCWRVAKQCADDECKRAPRMCLACAKTHHDVHEHKIDDMSSPLSAAEQTLCEVQTQQCLVHILSDLSPLASFCKNCDKLVCQVCIRTEHSEHDTVTVHEHNQATLNEIGELKEKAQNRMAKITGNVDVNPTNLIENIEQQRDEKIKQVEKLRAEMQTALDTSVAANIASIETVFKNRHATLTELKTKNAGWTQALKRVTQAETEPVSGSMKTTILKRLQDLDKCTSGPGVNLSNGLNDVNLHESAVRESVQLLRLWRATIDRRVDATPKVSRKTSADTLKAPQSLKSMPRTAEKAVSTPRIAQNCPSTVRRRQTAKKSRPLTEYFAKSNEQVERELELSENGEEVEDQLCDVCNSAEPTEGNEVIFCDGCNVAVHLECYGVADDFVVPEGDWFCSVCTTLDHGALPPCVLCPNVGGAMKSTKDGKKWAHLSCVSFIPETAWADDCDGEFVEVNDVPKARKALKCSICQKANKGACLQCSKPNCLLAYHVTCALKRNLELVYSGTDEASTFKSFCLRHSAKNRKHMGVYEKFYADKRIRFGLDRCQDDKVDESGFDPDARANTVTPEDETEFSLDTAADSAFVDQSSVAPLPGSASPSETAPSPDIETAAYTEPAPDIETAADTEPAPDTASPSPELTPLLEATLSPDSALSSYPTQRSDSADLPDTMPPNDTTNDEIHDFTAVSPQVSPPSTEPPPAKRCKPDDKNDENQVKNVVASIKSTTKFIVVPSFDPLSCRVCKSKTPVPMSCSECGLHVHLGCTLPLLSAKIKIKNLPLICRLCKTNDYPPNQLSSKDYLSNVTKEQAQLVFKGEQLLLAYLVKSQIAISKEKYAAAHKMMLTTKFVDFDELSRTLSDFFRSDISNEQLRLQFVAIWLKLSKFCKKGQTKELQDYLPVCLT